MTNITNPDLNCWTLEMNRDALPVLERLHAGLNKLMSNNSPEYQFEFIDSEFFRDQIEFSAERTDNYKMAFIIGESLDSPLGYALGYKGIGLESERFGFFETRKHDKIVKGEDLRQHRVYKNYSGNGEILTLALMETFLPGRGFGSQLLKHIQSDGYEIVDAGASGKLARRFFRRHGFVYTGLANDCPIYAWHNPEFLFNKTPRQLQPESSNE